MNKLFAIFALVTMATIGCRAQMASAQIAGTATTVTVNWGASAYSPANTPLCNGTTVTANCQQGYTVVITPPSGTAITIPACTLAQLAISPLPTTCVGPAATSYTWVSPTALNYGTYTASVTGNGLASVATGGTTATPLSSSPGTGTTIYALSVTAVGVPGGVGVSFK